MAITTRRSLIGGLGIGLTGAAIGVAGGFYLGRSRLIADIALLASPSPKVDGIIDTHHHMLPPFFVEAIGAQKIAAVMPNGVAPQWSPELDLQVMDEFKIRKAVLSVSPGLWTDTPEQAVALARRVNEFGARMVADHPSRYGHFAVMPLPDIDASLKEAAYALDTLKANGLIIFTNYGGAYLGDPRFEPLYQELDRRKAVLFVHPTKTPCHVTNIPEAILEFPFDTTRTVASLIYSGFPQRYPGIKFHIFARGRRGAVPGGPNGGARANESDPGEDITQRRHAGVEEFLLGYGLVLHRNLARFPFDSDRFVEGAFRLRFSVRAKIGDPFGSQEPQQIAVGARLDKRTARNGATPDAGLGLTIGNSGTQHLIDCIRYRVASCGSEAFDAREIAKFSSRDHFKVNHDFPFATSRLRATQGRGNGSPATGNGVYHASSRPHAKSPPHHPKPPKKASA